MNILSTIRVLFLNIDAGRTNVDGTNVCLCLLPRPVEFSLCLSSVQMVPPYFLASSPDSHSSPSYSPVPWVAQAA